MDGPPIPAPLRDGFGLALLLSFLPVASNLRASDGPVKSMVDTLLRAVVEIPLLLDGDYSIDIVGETKDKKLDQVLRPYYAISAGA